jgi:cysteine-rich CPXCG protein
MIEETIVTCASCGEAMALAVDTSAGDEQEYVEDCPVCCRPLDVFVRCRPGRILSVSVSAS